LINAGNFIGTFLVIGLGTGHLLEFSLKFLQVMIVTHYGLTIFAI